MPAAFAVAVRVFFLTSLAGAIGCGGAAGPPSRAMEAPPIGAALTATERTHVARAAYFASEVARYRKIAEQQRQLAVVDSERTPPARAADRIARRKAAAEARAAGADQIATRLQSIVDFHTAEAAKEGAQ